MEFNELNQEKLEQTPQEPQTRSKMLTVLCILSFIGSGFSIFGSLLYALFFDKFLDFYASNDSDLYRAMYDSLSILSPTYFLVELIFTIASLIGVVLMWKLRKIGFHTYTIANILILGLPLFFGVGGFNYPTLILITGPFIAMYGFQLKLMK